MSDGSWMAGARSGAGDSCHPYLPIMPRLAQADGSGLLRVVVVVVVVVGLGGRVGADCIGRFFTGGAGRRDLLLLLLLTGGAGVRVLVHGVSFRLVGARYQQKRLPVNLTANLCIIAYYKILSSKAKRGEYKGFKRTEKRSFSVLFSSILFVIMAASYSICKVLLIVVILLAIRGCLVSSWSSSIILCASLRAASTSLIFLRASIPRSDRPHCFMP